MKSINLCKDFFNLIIILYMNIREKSLEELNTEFKCILLKLLKRIKSNKIIIWLSWWTSVNTFYLQFKDIFLSIDKEKLNKIRFVFVDERIVDLDDKESNYYNLKKLIFDDLIKENIISENQILIPSFDWTYGEDIKKIDIWLFWIGEDWHVASIFPWQINFNIKYKKNFIFVNNSPKPPKDRISLNIRFLKTKVRNPFLFFIWNKKNQIYENFLLETEPNKLPWTIFKKNKKLIIFKEKI